MIQCGSRQYSVILEKEPAVKNSVLIEGFPGIGLVGNIASQYIVNELNMTYLGAMSSRFFPPLAVLRDCEHAREDL